MSEKPKTSLLTPQNLALVVQGITALIAAAPGALAVVRKARELIAALFSDGLISKAQQDALFNHVESLTALARAGIPPSHWTVEPDPQRDVASTGAGEAPAEP